MKEMIDNLERLVLLWILGLLGGIIFSLRKVFGRIKMVGYERKKFISQQEEVIVIFDYPFSWKPVIFPSLFFFSRVLSTAPALNEGKFWFFPLIANEKRGEKSIRRFIQRVKEGKIIVLTLNKEAEDDDNTSRVRRFQTGISILSKKTQTTTIPIFIEEEEKLIPNRSLLNDRIFFISVWGKEKTTAP